MSSSAGRIADVLRSIFLHLVVQQVQRRPPQQDLQAPQQQVLLAPALKLLVDHRILVQEHPTAHLTMLDFSLRLYCFQSSVYYSSSRVRSSSFCIGEEGYECAESGYTSSWDLGYMTITSRCQQCRTRCLSHRQNCRPTIMHTSWVAHQSRIKSISQRICRSTVDLERMPRNFEYSTSAFTNQSSADLRRSDQFHSPRGV